MMNKYGKNCPVLAVLFLVASLSSFQQKKIGPRTSAFVRITFINNIQGRRIVFNDSTYTNPFEERYTVTKLRYYVTNVSLQSDHSVTKENDSYYLVDESKAESRVIGFSVPDGDYHSLHFLLGVDSLHNVSGAQTGALDPANDMFWTWNTGYVMAKMEGNSPDSKQVNNKFEFHIGGFSGPNNVLQPVMLEFPGGHVHFTGGKTYDIIINADINTWWQHPNDIKISKHAVITSPGVLAKEISQNYANMFHIEKVSSD